MVLVTCGCVWCVSKVMIKCCHHPHTIITTVTATVTVATTTTTTTTTAKLPEYYAFVSRPLSLLMVRENVEQNKYVCVCGRAGLK